MHRLKITDKNVFDRGFPKHKTPRFLILRPLSAFKEPLLMGGFSFAEKL